VGHGLLCQAAAATGEHGQVLNVMKFAIFSAIESRPQIGHEDLGTLVKPHFAFVEVRFISERWYVSD